MSKSLEKKFRKKLDNKVKITVGVHEEESSRFDGKNNVEIGTKHEFGIGVPQRSFLRSTIFENTKAYIKALKNIGRITEKKDRQKACEELAVQVETDIKEKIKSNIPPPNAMSTVRKKGSTTPLIDTEQLLSSIKGKVQNF